MKLQITITFCRFHTFSVDVLRWIKLSKSQNKTFSGSYLATMALGDFCCFVHLQLSKLSYYFEPRFLFLRSPHSSKLRWLTDTSWSIFVEKCNNFGLAVFQSKRNWIMVYFCIYHIITVARVDSSFWPLKNYSISTYYHFWKIRHKLNGFRSKVIFHEEILCQNHIRNIITL